MYTLVWKRLRTNFLPSISGQNWGCWLILPQNLDLEFAVGPLQSIPDIAKVAITSQWYLELDVTGILNG